MKKIFSLIIICGMFLFPLVAWSQVPARDTTRVDSTKKVDSVKRVDSGAIARVDTIRVLVDTVVKKDC